MRKWNEINECEMARYRAWENMDADLDFQWDELPPCSRCGTEQEPDWDGCPVCDEYDFWTCGD